MPMYNGMKEQQNVPKKKKFWTPQFGGHRRSDSEERRMSDPYSKNSKPETPPSSVIDVETWEPNAEEKELLRLTWSNDFDFLYQLGTNIFSYIFETNPKAKTLFPYLMKYGDRWQECKEFKGMALKFAQILSLAIKHLYSMEQLAPTIYQIGIKHTNFAHRGFEPEHWNVFLDAMKHSLSKHIASLDNLDEHRKEAATKAWRALSIYIITHMKSGFMDGLKQMHKKK